MKKILTLEYKFRDFEDNEILLPKPTGVIAAFEKLNENRISQIRRLSLEFGSSFVVLPERNSCPLDPVCRVFAFDQLKKAISQKPDVIWFDYLKFPGKWKILDEASDYVIHKECKYCKGVDRQKEITKLGEILIGNVPKEIKTGVFTMPLMMGEYSNWEKILGQNLTELGNIFDYISPMLYHRMIKKPVSYISEHITYLESLGLNAEILPIIQLKDMPDELEDTLSLEEFEESVKNSIRPPSNGVAVFSWDQAIEKNKLLGASEILNELL